MGGGLRARVRRAVEIFARGQQRRVPPKLPDEQQSGSNSQGGLSG